MQASGEVFFINDIRAEIIDQLVGKEGVIAERSANSFFIPTGLFHPAQMLPGVGVMTIDKAGIKSAGDDLSGPVAGVFTQGVGTDDLRDPCLLVELGIVVMDEQFHLIDHGAVVVESGFVGFGLWHAILNSQCTAIKIVRRG